MADVPPARIVRLPSDDEAKAIFEEYTLAVGKVAFAWNFLHERFSKLFVAVMAADSDMSLGIWYSTKSDRAQRDMLEGAIASAKDDRWLQRLPKAKDDLLSLMKRANDLGNKRNDAVHAPCSLTTGAEGSEMTASYFTRHPSLKI